MSKASTKLRVHPLLLLLLAGVALLYAWIYLAPQPSLETQLWSHLKVGTGIKRSPTDTSIKGIISEKDFQGDYSVSIVISASEEEILLLQSQLLAKSPDIKFTPLDYKRIWDNQNAEASNIERIAIPPGTMMAELWGPRDFLQYFGFNRSTGQIFYQSVSW